jgi:hypothetical protein
MLQQKASSGINRVVWFSRILRWALGVVFITIGMLYLKTDTTAWAIIGFGAVLFITGFFKPRRCIEDGTP